MTMLVRPWSSRGARLELLLTGLLTAWVISPFVRPDRFVTSFDTVAYGGPNLAFTLEAFRDGYLPSWNDRIFGGVAHLANPQAGVLYPFKLLFVPVEAHRALLLLVAIHIALLGAGVFVLVRYRLHMAPPAGLVAVAITISSGMVGTKGLQFEQILVLAWVPWVMVASDVAIERRSVGGVASVAATTALMLVAGHPQLVYIAAPLIIVWLLGRVIDRRSVVGGAVAAAGGLAGLGLASPQLLPVVELASRAATSGGRDLSQVSVPSYSLGVERLPQTLFGDLFVANQTLVVNGFEPMVFVGTVAAVLAVAGSVGALRSDSPNRASMLLFTAAGAIALVLSVGPRTPIFRAAFSLVPGFDLARVPGRWAVVTTLTVAVLAAYALSSLTSRAKVGIVAAVGVVSLGMAVLVVMAEISWPPARTIAIWALVTLVVSLPALVVSAPRRPAVVWGTAFLLAAELAVLSRGIPARQSYLDVPFTTIEGDIVRYLAGRADRSVSLTFDDVGNYPYLIRSLRPNANVINQIRSVDGYDGGTQVTRRWVDAIDPLAIQPVNPELALRSQVAVPLDPREYAELGVRYAVIETRVLPASVQVPGWDGPLVKEDTYELWENPAYRGQGWLVDRGEHQPVRVDFRRPGSVRVRTGDRAGLVVIAEQFDPGWRATVDGARRPVVAHGGFLVSVKAPADAEVRFTYEPPYFRQGLAIAGAVAFGIALAFVMERRRRREEQAS